MIFFYVDSLLANGSATRREIRMRQGMSSFTKSLLLRLSTSKVEMNAFSTPVLADDDSTCKQLLQLFADLNLP